MSFELIKRIRIKKYYENEYFEDIFKTFLNLKLIFLSWQIHESDSKKR